ncbi:putative protein kinase RLK-Pelle-L-LEC family [Lupinus albus]|uniref:non-specific serine/threonine protein kinase n=1 Tax=Lupinus albus TaxID=3870 RepID=A0A6A4P6Q7_LUPAL|nr:putative protein kinase RLK-Pelle-L-LEC family [Lupinus albus]
MLYHIYLLQSNSIMAKIQVLFLILILASNLVISKQQELLFEGFRASDTNISLYGSAVIENNGLLSLTSDKPRLIGHAFYQTPIQFKKNSSSKVLSFSTSFVFSIRPQYPKLGGHGFAFTISPSKTLEGAYPLQYLGLLNPNNLGNFSNHIFAVEFDTVQDYELHDINNNHVGININNMVSEKSVKAEFFREGSREKLQDINLLNGNVIQAMVDYDSTRNKLEVRLSPYSSKPKYPILSYEVDLSPILHDQMYVGFSSSTGMLSSWHYILGWRFKINGESKTLDFETLPLLPTSKNTSNESLIIELSLSSLILLLLLIGLIIFIIRKIRNTDHDVVEAWELEIGPHRFSYKDLKKATNGFDDNQLLGFGGFGRVYKGVHPNSNTEIAVKGVSHESKQGLQEFMSEIETIGKLRHRNLIQLLGWCRKQRELLLVYEFMHNGSLDKYIFGRPRITLSWEQRFNIIKGVASGILYLHEEWEQVVIHRDIKAGNKRVHFFRTKICCPQPRSAPIKK